VGIAELHTCDVAASLELAQQSLAIELGRLGEPIGLWNLVLSHDDE
jgi:hypothetical protein